MISSPEVTRGTHIRKGSRCSSECNLGVTRALFNPLKILKTENFRLAAAVYKGTLR